HLPAEDTFVWEAKPTVNFGNTTDLLIGQDEFSAISRTLLKFDLSSTEPEWRLEEVKVRIRVKQGTAGTYAVHVLTEDWAENQATWQNQPSFESTPLVIVEKNETEGWIEFDIQDLYLEWITEE